MKIWFGTTTLKYKKYKKHYLMIRKYLIDHGHVLTDDWIGKHGSWIEENPYATRDIKNVYQSVINAINEADASIIEFTVPNFSTSHQITYSLQRRKPTLVLRLNRENTFKDSYIDAIESPFLTIKEYNTQNFKEIINEFLGLSEYEDGQGRYNVVLSVKNKYYLDWASLKYKKSKSKIIRDLIEKEMIGNEDFSIYLKSGNKNKAVDRS